MKNKKIIIFLLMITLIPFMKIKAEQLFRCEIGDYLILFNENGDIDRVSIKDSTGYYRIYCDDCTYKTVFKPENKSECPTSARFLYDSDNKIVSVLSNKIRCGNITNIPVKIPQITSYMITVIQVLIPIILIVMGTIDLLKGVIAQKEDDINKSKSIFIKKLITAAIIFFIVAFVKLIVSFISSTTEINSISDCIDCFISNDCD